VRDDAAGRPEWPRPAWEQRFRAPRVFLPAWARHAPERCAVIASAGGVLQVHSFDARSGKRVAATDRPEGTDRASIDPNGHWIWWFDDAGGDELGVWRRQPFGSSARRRPETPIPLRAAYDAGLLLGSDGTVVVGRSHESYGTRIHQLTVGPAGAGNDLPVLIYSSPHDAEAAALSEDANLVAVEHSERGDSRHPALRIVAADTGSPLADLDDGAGLGLWALGFAPTVGNARLLVQHERGGRPELLIWDTATGTQTPVGISVPGDVAGASWYPDGGALLVAVDHQARTLLYRYDLGNRSTTRVGPATGSVSGATARPDGDIWCAWSSAAEPRSVRSLTHGTEVVPFNGARAPSSVPVTDVWVDGPGGPIHALLRVPEGEQAPHPTVVAVHGGPTWHDSDSFSPSAAAWVDHGYAVLEVNYRGSTGYGSAWRDALEAKVGFVELEDIAAVHQALVERGVVDPARSVLTGASWGGYLTLLGLGTQPDRWTLGVAEVPVADYVAAYEDEMESLRAFDRALLGGSPEEVPEAYRVSSPITYVDQVRVPVLVLAGENDPRCPIRQIESYVEALHARGGVCEVDRFDAGHGSLVDDERVRQMRAALGFVARHLP
jgi:dipeptidyl aminopeptidase/acylaminoacyl peptidase